MTTASEYFGAMAAEYDSLVRRAIPRYDEMIERIIAYMPGEATRILELGCGSGNLSTAVAERYPDAELTLVDASPEMLATARSRLAPERDVRLVEARFEDIDFAPGAFDLVTSGLALHHVADKLALFGTIRAVLQPGGTLLYGDQMRGGTDAFHALNWNSMETFWQLPGHLEQDEMSGLRQHADEHDHYVSVLEQFRLLETAGFEAIDICWRNWMWGIIHGRAPAS